ncbi:MAG: DUF2252 domain-containing protein [Tractidigestivibacter sp.]|jgi:uncharacterized protein (DUF2252 family)|uniref:DUF2252 domain-containing protein n=1 Tax=Tractidigestivibacter sp. TaxID=2847320 RepID=UPI003D8FE096
MDIDGIRNLRKLPGEKSIELPLLAAEVPLASGALLDRLRSSVNAELHGQEHQDREESRTAGKALRKKVPRRSHAEWVVSEDRSAAMELIRGQERGRVQELLPIRHQRMAESPFSFFRGAAVTMAADLATTPTTDIRVQACGDAHLANFGIFASPERRLVFDINDFDETLPAPWEWDIKRLATSVEVCGRHLGLSAEERLHAVRDAASGYHEAINAFAKMGNLEVWYAHMDVEGIIQEHEDYLGKAERTEFRRVTKRAASKNSSRAVAKLTEVVDGQLRIVSDPPLLVPFRELDTIGVSQEDAGRFIGAILGRYRMTLPRERRELVDQYVTDDVARKVVGVGSVGMRNWILVMEGADKDDPLVLQVKEATDSVLEPYAGRSTFREHGRRVVEGQRAIQTAGDILLGWVRAPTFDGSMHDFYVRQLWDAKGSVDLEKMDSHELSRFSRLCGWTLAHAHAKTGNRFEIAGYLGKGDGFDEAICEFAQSYADQNEIDYQAFLASFPDAKDGR